MTRGTRSLAVLGALSLSAVGLVPAAWATDAGAKLTQVAQSGEQRAPETSGTPTAQGSGITQGQSASSMSGGGAAERP